LVTGASGAIGAAIARGLALGGARVRATYRSRPESVEELRRSLGDHADRVTASALDVTDATASDALVRDIVAGEGRLDCLVVCAGAPRDGFLVRAKPAEIAATLDLNLGGALLSMRAAVAPMIKARYGRIVLVGSVVASMGNAGQVAYAAAKAGLEGATRSLAREVGSRGITVNCVSPGFIETDMTAKLGEEARARATASSAVGRLGTPEDVAHAVLHLCEEASGFVTGTVLQVSGGLYM
jgi:3-oxoacyl-[acyl-carrier protein] reductase